VLRCGKEGIVGPACYEKGVEIGEWHDMDWVALSLTTIEVASNTPTGASS
jgi:hypothetical protein